MKMIGLILIYSGILGIAWVFLPTIIFNILFFINDEVARFFISLFVTSIVIGLSAILYDAKSGNKNDKKNP